MTQKTWAKSDYSSSATYDLDGTVYTDQEMTTTATLTDFSSNELRIIHPYTEKTLYSSSSVVTLGSSGTFTIRFTISDSPYVTGMVKIILVLTSSSDRVTCVGVNGSNNVFFEPN